MKDIHTLIPDVYQVLSTKGWWTPGTSIEFSKTIGLRMQENFGIQQEQSPRLRLSRMGMQCPRALWYSIHHPELEEAIPPWATFKYQYGHIIEALAIVLARASGHSVAGEQDEITLDGVTGHRDCVIDGCVVDVKSTSSPGFIKFKAGTLWKDDSFGYLDQLDGYVLGSALDPLVQVKDKGYILAIDKQLGHMALYEHRIREQSIRDRIRDYKAIIEAGEPPPCTCETVSDGAAGNIALGVTASYSRFKHCCFPGLRTFLYSGGPRYLTKVMRIPRRQDGTYIPEVDKHGKSVY